MSGLFGTHVDPMRKARKSAGAMDGSHVVYLPLLAIPLSRP